MAPNLSRKQWVLSHLTLMLILSLVLIQFFQVHARGLSLSFLDVGQGDAILIQTPEFKNILIDTGPDGKVVEELGHKLNFFNQKIDLFILTHPDLDHYGGILDILQKYPVEAIMLTGISSKSQLYQAFLAEMKKQDIQLIFPTADRDWQISQGYFLDILYPFSGESLVGLETKNKNDTSTSLILRDASGTALILLTGDAEQAQERDLLLSGQDLSAPLFKLGHHGSKTSNNQSFLDAIMPKTVIVSAGQDNKFGHPHPEVMERVSHLNILDTRNGTISPNF
ncbi:MAG: MBL fold metallo-hydrolase [Candidatus Peregrinibacteria bacterium]|nr:MBL fold metallo-hydrolase [Candidatus Peregrinibacteria bacterium]